MSADVNGNILKILVETFHLTPFEVMEDYLKMLDLMLLKNVHDYSEQNIFKHFVKDFSLC